MKNIYLYIAITVYCLVYVSCNTYLSPLTESFKEQENITLQEMKNFPTDSIGEPLYIYSFDNYTILVEPKLDFLLASYNVSTQKYQRKLKKGRGPQEFLDIQQINRATNDSSFFVMDTYTQKTFVYSFKHDSLIITDTLKIPSSTASFCCDNNLIIGSLSGEKQRFFIKDARTDSIQYFGANINIRDYPNEILSQTLTGFSYNSTKQKRMAFFSLYGDFFEIYDYSNPQTITLINQTIMSLPVFKTETIRGKNVAVFSPKTNIGVTSLTGNDKYIFALYTNHTFKDAEALKNNLFYGNKILVYDWNGNAITILQLDQNVKSICYNKKDDKIYAINFNEKGPQVLFIDCKSLPL